MTWPNGGQNWGQQPPGHSGSPYQQGSGWTGAGQQPGYPPHYPAQPPPDPGQRFEDPLRGRPPKRRRTGLIITAALGGAVLLGAVIGGVLVGVRQPAADPRPLPAPAQPSTGFTPPPAPPATIPGWKVGYNPQAQLAYDVPPDWTPLPPGETWKAEVLGDVTFGGLVNGPGYSCDRVSQARGQVGSTAVRPTKGLEETAVQIAQLLAPEFYHSAEVALAAPQHTTVDGVPAVRVAGSITPVAGAPCMPTAATIEVIALQGKESHVVAVAVGDSGGGVRTPPARGATQVPQIIASARPVR